ncbi:hypothetical protein R1sor_008633 [Riccia sorocarpa]|uniref:Uncharacterized protein n=1 Tax=Riccia sorocarpa TaxID=122646 RepID=A0ABD3HTZ7_9MARC
MADQWGGKRKREKSPVIETSEALAFQNISTLVQAMESEAWGQTILNRDEVLPFVDTSRVKNDGIVTINSAMFSRGAVEGAKEYNIDISVEGLRRLVDFPAAGDCAKIVKPFVIEKAFFDHCGQKHKKEVWKVIVPWFSFNVNNAQPRNEGWVVDDFRKFTLENHPHGSVLDMKIRKSLNHEKTDRKSVGKFREGWAAIIDLVRNEFMAKQAAQNNEPLYLDAKNVFSDTKAEWDNEKCELVRQREELKEELAKAQELKAQAERREETIRLEKEALEVEYSKEKADWESKNQKLVDEVSQLHEDMKKVSTKEERVQVELLQIRSQMEDSAKNTGETTELKLELEAKEEELRKLQEVDKKIRQKLKTAKRKGKELEGELKKIPAGVLVKPESKVMDLLKSGKKWQLSYGCSQTLPTAWIHEFYLDREVDFVALKERYMCSWDIRSLPPNVELYDTQ